MQFFTLYPFICSLLLFLPVYCDSHLDGLAHVHHHALRHRSVNHAHNIHTKDSLLVRRQNDTDMIEKPPLLANSTNNDIQKARELVKAAISKAAQHNKARLDKPQRNSYTLDPKSQTGLVRKDTVLTGNTTIVEDAPPLFKVTDEIAAAAALLAEAEAYEEVVSNSTLTKRHLERRAKRASKWWMGNIAHTSPPGGWPFGKNPSDFRVFRDVTDDKYGAKGDGITVGLISLALLKRY